MAKAARPSLLGMGLSLPWCCIAPGVLSLIGAGSVGMARILARELMPSFLLLALILLGRAHYLLYVRHEGNRFSQMSTWISTGLLIGVSILRFWPY